jgi:hypothetical protein
MPAGHRIGLDEHEDRGPSRPEPTERDPEESVGSPDPGPAIPEGKRGELQPEREVLEREVGAAAARRAEGAEQHQKQAMRHWISVYDGGGNSNPSGRIE